MENNLQQEFIQVWKRINAKSDLMLVFTNLVMRYAEPHRYYHRWQHILDCHKLFSTLHGIPNRDAVFLAILFHDAIYDTHKHDNEARSAELARSVLTKAGVAENVILDVERFIMITRHNVTPQSLDEQFMVDIDLSIFGKSPKIFDQYELDIRREYEWVELSTYTEERLKILSGFYNRDHIYYGPFMEGTYGRIAKANLKCSISFLEAQRIHANT